MLTSGPGTVAAGWPSTDWTGQSQTGGSWSGNRPRHGIGAFATLLAALASFLLVYDVILVGFRFPLPGRLGLLVAIFTLIRGLIRRIFRGRR